MCKFGGGVSGRRFEGHVRSGAFLSVMGRIGIGGNRFFFVRSNALRTVKGKVLLTRVRRGSGAACHMCSCGHLKISKGPERLRARGTLSIAGYRPPGGGNMVPPIIGGSNCSRGRLASYRLFSIGSIAMGGDCSSMTSDGSFMSVLIVSNGNFLVYRGRAFPLYGNSDCFVDTSDKRFGVYKGIGLVRAEM